ncbi:MAG: RDD family protein [Flavobacteriaceae bacterium]
MDNFQIETAQNITIQQNVAHITTRMGSYLLDILIIIAYYVLIIFILALMNYSASLDNASTIVLLSIPPFLYFLVFESLMNGQTPGKAINKIRVVKIDGSKPTFGSYIIRWILGLIELSMFGGSLATLTILLSSKGQRLGDMAAGTTVISEKKRVTLKNTFAEDIVENYIPTFPQVTMLTDKDVRTIKEIFINAKRKMDHKVILKLYTKVVDITGIKTDMKPMEFIDIVIKDYNYYTQ